MINFSVLFIYQIFFLNDLLSIKVEKLSFLEIFATIITIYSYFFLGLYDDKFQLRPNTKFFISLIFGLFVIFLNDKLMIKMISVSFYENKIFFENYSYLFSVFCILVLVNALNFYDGINGQSCVIFILFFSYLFVKSEMNYFYFFTILLLLFVFLLNITNKLFLGDGGIYFLSIILSLSLINEHNINKNITYADEIFFLLLLPGMDLLRLTIFRLLKLKNPFYGDRNHIHHLMINKFSLLNSNLTLFCVSLIPIILFSYFDMNFFLVFSTFLAIYVFLIKFLKSDDKKNTHK